MSVIWSCHCYSSCRDKGVCTNKIICLTLNKNALQITFNSFDLIRITIASVFASNSALFFCFVYSPARTHSHYLSPRDVPCSYSELNKWTLKNLQVCCEERRQFRGYLWALPLIKYVDGSDLTCIRIRPYAAKWRIDCCLIIQYLYQILHFYEPSHFPEIHFCLFFFSVFKKCTWYM